MKNRRSILFLLLFIPFISLTQSKISDKYQGLLWEVKKPGSNQVSYLFGTMHVSSKVAFHLSDSFYVAIKSVNVVGLETNPEFWLEDMLNSELYSFYMHGGFQIENPGFYENEFLLSRLDKEGLKYLLSFDSDFSNNLLYRKSQGYDNNFQENTYLDMFIYQAGKKLGKIVTNLEDFNESQELVIESQYAERNGKENNTRNQYDFGDKSPFDMIQDAYREGNLDLLDSIGKITGTEEGRKFMLYIRNTNIANSMDSIIKSGKSVFGAVGAAHLPGKNGVIEELRKKGYILRPVGQTKKRNEAEKEKLDAIVHPFQFQQISSSDGGFTSYLPGKIVEPPMDLVYNEYQVPDMANGGNYFIRRVNTFGPLYGEDEAYMAKRIDSLLFENIPGKIIKLEHSKKDEYGHPIISITNETKQGDFQRYKIIVTPYELYMFKVIGHKKYATENAVKPFLDNSKVNYNYSQEWRSVSPYFEGFKVDVPGAVKIQDSRNFTTLNKNAVIQSYDKASKSYFILIQNTLNDQFYIEEDTFELKYICDHFCEEAGYKNISNSTFSSTDGSPSYTHQAKNEKDETVYCKTIIRGAHYYLLVVKTTQHEFADKYFDSFKFKDFKIENEVRTLVDTSFLFTVKTNAKNPRSKFDKLFNYRYNGADDEDDKFRSKTESIDFFFTETGEEISVSFSKYHDYEYLNFEDSYADDQYINDFVEDEDESEFAAYEDDLLYEDEPYLEDEIDQSKFKISKNEFMSSNGDLKWKEYLITRKNSSRGIYGRFLVYKDRCYNLRATIDTAAGPSQFIVDFMDNFTPIDTMVGIPIHQHKDSIFFAHLTGTDSLLQTRALQSIRVLDFSDKNSEQMIAVLDTLNFSRFENGFNSRLILIEYSGHISDKKYLDFLEKKYIEAEDTSSLQIAILKAITTTETEANHKLFIKLLLQETPLTNSGKIDELFDYLEDSIVLNKLLYPKLFELSSVPEYTNNVYSVLVALLDSGHIDKSFYSSKLDYLYREAKMEMKRFNNESIDASQLKDRYSYNGEYLLGYKYLQNPKLGNLLRLLLPFYKEDERIEKLFNKMLEIRNIHSVCFLAQTLNKVDIKVDSSVWKELLKKEEKYAYAIHQTLKDLKQTTTLEALNITSDMLAKSIFIYNTDIELDKKDSVELHSIRKTSYQNEPLHVYIYKYKQEPKYGTNKAQWKLAIVGVLPENKISPCFDEIENDGISIKLNKDIEETINKELKSLRFIDRQRASYSNYDYYDDYDY